MKKDYSALIWGLIFVVVGIIFGGNALNIWDIDIFFPGWWTLFLIIPGLISMVRYGFNWGSGILVIIGLVLLFDALDIIDDGVIWKLIFPLVLVAVGISIIASFFRTGTKKGIKSEEYSKSKSYKYDSTQYPRYTAILGGGDYKNNTEDLKGVVAEAILGGLSIDLRDAKITEDIVLELTAVLGGIDIFIPDNVRVEIISGVPVLGGFEHKINRNAISGPKVRIKYTAVLGGIEVK
ncbi:MULTISPECIES: hypothetical protein [unclassified Clostridium]|uniref:LiaF transmembrane domain-containing protein n=1 Tax=unclassified Clostridium TaxID=2614128 RepID=UPI0018977428|nr:MULTISPECIES: hypothetical protein [unclassified Clostridium]MBP3917283.1 hypothetical protein [Clostridium sp.]MEE0932668.1 hypothetical protein [Clostridium sp.]